jgi:hypothetical protein
MKASVIKQHLSHAKRDIAAGVTSFRSAANHIAAAVKGGATQAEAAAKVGKSQPWVNRLLKWRESGFKENSPFDADHARAFISGANNPAERTVPMTLNITHAAGAHKELALEFTRGADPSEKFTRGGPLGEVTRSGKGCEIVRRGNGPPLIYGRPLALLVKLEELEKQADDFNMTVQQHGRVAGSALEARIKAVADKLLSLIEQKDATPRLQ